MFAGNSDESSDSEAASDVASPKKGDEKTMKTDSSNHGALIEYVHLSFRGRL